MKNNYSDLGKKEFNKNNLDLALLYYKFDVYYNNDLKYLAYYNIGVIYFLKKDYKSSLKFFKNSIILNPNWYKSWRILGDVLEELKLYVKAIIAFKRCGELSIFSDEINNKILKIENKLISLEDTEDSDSYCNENENKEESNNFNFENFKKTFYNYKIQKLLEDDKLKNKLLASNGNPMVIFKDKEIYNLMNEMYLDYKKK
tara:strand:- start:78 stop:680 length:603 start_codon:yes stop_codon:yes gene_type:complete